MDIIHGDHLHDSYSSIIMYTFQHHQFCDGSDQSKSLCTDFRTAHHAIPAHTDAPHQP